MPSIRERYPPPWRVDEMPAGFRVIDRNGTALCYIYALEGFTRGAVPNALTRAEALSVAKAIARLPETK